MELTQEQQTTGMLYAINGAEFSYSDWHKGETLVERHGLIRPTFTLIHNNHEIAYLEWRRARAGIYKARDLELALQIGLMARCIKATDEHSRISTMQIHSPISPKRPKMTISLSDSDTFSIYEKQNHFVYSLCITKDHYVNHLLEIELTKRHKTIARINVPALMRWEAHHFHHLLSLVMSWIAFSYEHGIYGVHRSNFTHGRVALGRW